MPDEEIGIVFVVLGVVLMAVGFLFWPICGIGILLLIIGIVFVATAQSRSHQYAAPGYGYPSSPPYAYPPEPPAAGMPAPPGQAQYSQPLCPVCSSPLSWVPQYGRWYCSRCQTYR